MSDERYEIQQTNQNVYQANETEGENFEREYEKGARNSSETGPELGKPKKGKKPYLKENHKRLLKRAAALWKDAKAQKEKEAEKPQEEKTARVRLNDKRKMSFKEKREFEQLEKEIAELETEKVQIEELLCSGTLSVDELTEKSKRLPEVNDLIDEKTMRWLELSEIEG